LPPVLDKADFDSSGTYGKRDTLKVKEVNKMFITKDF